MPASHTVAQFCSQRDCPRSPGEVEPFCTVCPAAPLGDMPACTPNIFGSTHRYPSSCGGSNVEVTYGFDRVVWQFDATGQLVGVSWGSDTSGEMTYGRQCSRTGEAEDVCRSLAEAGGAGAGGASGG